jgi:hypothetical protein
VDPGRETHFPLFDPRRTIGAVSAARVHSGELPERHAAVLARTLRAAGVEHAAGSTPEEAAADADCVAFIGPFRSWRAALAAPVLNAAGIVQVCPAATWAALTRADEPSGDDEAPDLRPAGRATLVRLVPRDTEVCRRLVENAPERRLAVVADHESYGRQLAQQLRLAGLEERPGEPDAVVYCGLAENAPHGLLAGRRVYAFDGAQGFGDAHTRYVLPIVPLDGWSGADLHAYVPQLRQAGELVARAVERGGADREAVLRAVWELGGFDEHGDPPRGPVGVWRTGGSEGALTCEAVW